MKPGLSSLQFLTLQRGYPTAVFYIYPFPLQMASIKTTLSFSILCFLKKYSHFLFFKKSFVYNP